MRDLPLLLDAIQEQPDDGPRWLALAAWLGEERPDDEAIAVRVFWPTLRDNVVEFGVLLDKTLAGLTENAAVLGSVARQIEQRRYEPSE
jgi:hypothetical protein